VCQQAKKFLAKRGISFEERDIRSDSENERILMEELDSRTTPTLVADGKVIVGFDREEYLLLAPEVPQHKPNRQGGI